MYVMENLALFVDCRGFCVSQGAELFSLIDCTPGPPGWFTPYGHQHTSGLHRAWLSPECRFGEDHCKEIKGLVSGNPLLHSISQGKTVQAHPTSFKHEVFPSSMPRCHLFTSEVEECGTFEDKLTFQPLHLGVQTQPWKRVPFEKFVPDD
jgi:hypothetical protein